MLDIKFFIEGAVSYVRLKVKIALVTNLLQGALLFKDGWARGVGAEYLKTVELVLLEMQCIISW